MKYIAWLPPEGTRILVVLFLSFLIGLEREERKDNDDHYAFGGVRTFPLIGLIGYSMALLSGGELLPQALGFAVVAGFLMISYWHKLASSGYSGVTSEMSGLATYLVGALVYHEMFWIATTLTVASIVLAGTQSRPGKPGEAHRSHGHPHLCQIPAAVCSYSAASCRTSSSANSRSTRSRHGWLLWR